MKRRNCKICGEYSAKRKVCLKCKEKYPFQTRIEGGTPFNRLEEHNKFLRKMK